MQVVVFEPDEFYCVEVEDDARYITVRRPNGTFRRCFIECCVSLDHGYMVYVIRNREVSDGEIFKAARHFGATVIRRSVPPAE